MKKFLHFLCFLMLLSLPAVPAAAADGTTGEITGGLEIFSGDFNNAKFNEYRVDRQGPIGGFFNADFLSMPVDGTHRYRFDLGYRSLEDVDLDIGILDYGKYNLDLGYQRFGHYFAHDVKSLYSGDGTGKLTIPSQVRNQINPGGVFSLAGLEPAVGSAHTIDLFLTRDRFNAGFDWMSLNPLTFHTDFAYEHREGDRPYGATLGFANAIEIPEPIKYDTYNVKAGTEYAGKLLYADATYSHSSFDNSIQSVTYDNIKQLTGVNTAAVPSQGRNALAPSNAYDSVAVVLAKNLPLNSRLIFNFSYAWFRQDENLIPPTINPVNFVPLTASARAATDTSSYDVRFSTRPVDRLEIKAGYRYYKHDNMTPEDKIFPFAPYDSQAVSPSDPTNYVSWISRTANVEASYEVFNRTNVGAAYEYTDESYKNGSERDWDENGYKVFMDSRAFDWMTSRLTLEFKDRNTLYPDYTEGELPWLRKYYAASDERYRASILNMFMPMDDLSVSLEYAYSEDHYGDSLFGLLNDRTHTATLETDYQLAKNVTVGAFYTYENQRTRQKSRQWNPAAIGDPFTPAFAAPGSFSNWQLKQNYNIHTVGLNSTIGIIPDKLSLELDGIYTVADGEANFASGIGTVGVDDLNPYKLLPYDHVDETELVQAGGKINYNVTKKLGLTLGYRYEMWHINDYQYNAPRNVVLNAALGYKNLLTMDSLYKPYEVHTAIAMATYKF